MAGNCYAFEASLGYKVRFLHMSLYRMNQTKVDSDFEGFAIYNTALSVLQW